MSPSPCSQGQACALGMLAGRPCLCSQTRRGRVKAALRAARGKKEREKEGRNVRGRKQRWCDAAGVEIWEQPVRGDLVQAVIPYRRELEEAETGEAWAQQSSASLISGFPPPTSIPARPLSDHSTSNTESPLFKLPRAVGQSFHLPRASAEHNTHTVLLLGCSLPPHRIPEPQNQLGKDL